MDAQRFRDEIFELHEFLNAWLTGQVPRGNGIPVRLERSLADDFTVIHPNGHSGTKSEAVDGFAAAWNEKPDSYALRVADVRTRVLGSGYCLATYREWHEGEPGRGRIATALLQRSNPTGDIKWLFLQETAAPHFEPAQRGATTASTKS